MSESATRSLMWPTVDQIVVACNFSRLIAQSIPLTTLSVEVLKTKKYNS